MFVPEHPKAFCGGWYYEHRLVMERDKGRMLDCDETIHHINHNKSDNRLANLFICCEDEHLKAHDAILAFI